MQAIFGRGSRCLDRRKDLYNQEGIEGIHDELSYQEDQQAPRLRDRTRDQHYQVPSMQLVLNDRDRLAR